MATDSDGDGTLDVELAGAGQKDFRVEASDIPHGSLLYNQVANLAQGDEVVFSGKFVSGDTDYIEESSLTEEGSMTAPEFPFTFTSIGRQPAPPVTTAAPSSGATSADDRGTSPAQLAAIRKAAEQGDAGAQYNLGVMYDNGRGVPQDYAEAYFWHELAFVDADSSFDGLDLKDIAKGQTEAASHLTPDELSQVQARAQKWLESHHPATEHSAIIVPAAPTPMSPDCLASFNSAIPSITSQRFAPVSFGSSDDASIIFQRLIVDPVDPSGMPEAVAALSAGAGGSNYTLPICVASGSGYRVYIPQDVVMLSVYWDTGRYLETGDFTADLFIDYQPGSKTWNNLVDQIREQGKVSSPETFQYIEEIVLYNHAANSIRIDRAIAIDRNGTTMGSVKVTQEAIPLAGSNFIRAKTAANNTAILLREAARTPELKNGAN